MGGKTHPPYPSEVRAEAVELVRTSRKSIPQVARDLGVSKPGLRGWIKQAEIDAGRGQPGDVTTDERAEHRRLRRENQVLRPEREILTKAAAFSATETT